MMAAASDGVVGLEQRLGGDALDVLVLRAVEDAVAYTAGPDEAREAKLGEMLRDRGRLGAHMRGELVHRVLAMEQRPEDSKPGRVREQLEGVRRDLELIVRRFPAYLRTHADSMARLRAVNQPGE